MNKLFKRGAVLALAFAGLMAVDAKAQLVISQYYEGNVGSNRLLEIWNHSAGDIDFSAQNLAINIYTNGSSTIGATFTLNSGSLTAGSVLVIANTDSTGDTAISTAGLTVIDTTSSAINFNGDDALELVLGSTTLDIVGQIGFDPGSSWSGSGVSTANQNIELLSASLTTGDLLGSNAYDPSARYSFVTAADVTSGSFTGFGVAPVPEPSTYALISMGLGLIYFIRRRRSYS